jgi:sigma-B regulation protein RsbU (phosphoserine phosphatase)
MRHALRTRLNHIVGYGDLLRQDAEEAGRAELAKLFATIGESALSLRGPLFRLLAPLRPSPGEEQELGKQIYGILYELIGMVQDAKRQSEAKGDATLASDIGKILEAANAILEIITSRASSDEEPDVESVLAEPATARLGSLALPTPPGPGRILVVDDNFFNRELLGRHLERQGYAVRAAEDGPAALRLLGSEEFDIMILDVMMPGMNGYQLLERIKGDEGLKDIHVIVISALADTQSIARCIQLGAEDYLPREFEPVILRARIESCLEKKRLEAERELYVNALVEAQERLRAELRGGAAYVRGLLPPRLSRPDIRTDWMFIPSASLGGDAFGYNAVAGGKLALYLIDVSGHGIEAALFSVTLLNLLKTQVLPGVDFADPASVLARLNASFRMEDQNNLYFTAWYGVYDPASRSLSYASAGSPPAVLVLPGGGAIELSSEGVIVGMDPDAAYSARSCPVPPQSRLYLFSDGAYEFRDRSGGIFGLEPFVGVLSARVAVSPPDVSVLDGLLQDVQAISSTTRFSDDVSLVEFRFG